MGMDLEQTSDTHPFQEEWGQRQSMEEQADQGGEVAYLVLHLEQEGVPHTWLEEAVATAPMARFMWTTDQMCLRIFGV